MRIGVDEAGKGPVLGSMFAAAVRADPAELPKDIDDSKTLSSEHRETLAAAIHEYASAVAVVEIPVERIDDPATDMNTLTVNAHAEALVEVTDSETPIMVDAGEINADRFGRRIAQEIESSVDISARHKADARDPLVGAASIIAKVNRDAHVETLAERYGPVGSGYPSDTTTREFLSSYVYEHGSLPDCARQSWQTTEDVVAAAEQADIEEFI